MGHPGPPRSSAVGAFDLATADRIPNPPHNFVVRDDATRHNARVPPDDARHGGQVASDPALTSAPGADAGTLHEVFERTALAQPQAIAIEVPPGAGRPARASLTYAEVLACSKALAARLAPLISA